MQFQRGRILSAMVAVLLSGYTLTGCGGEDHQSDKDFLESVRNSDAKGETADGTIPPLGDPMDDVAKIRVETTEMDVGLIANDRIHHDKLKVYNDGKMPLKLTRVDTTCACTQGHIAPDNAVVPPGGESWIDVTVDPKRIPGFHSHKVLTITSTDPNRGLVEVGVTAEVEPEFAIESDEIALGDIKKGETIEKTIWFRQLQEAPITLGEVEPMTLGPTNPKVPGVSGEVVPVPEAEWQTPGKREYKIVLRVGPDLPAGPFERTVLLHMDTARWSRHRIDVAGNVLAPYTVLPQYPQRALLKPDPATGAAEANVLISAETPISLSDISTDRDDIQVVPTAATAPNEAGFKATMSGGTPALPLDEVIRFNVHVGERVFSEFVGVRSLPGQGSGHDHGLGEGHSPDDGHNH